MRLAAGRLQTQAQVAAQQAAQTAQTAQRNAPQYLAQGRAVAAESRQLGLSFWKRLAHAGRMLGHEVTGVFFALLALSFAQGAWRARTSYHSGAGHWHFLLPFTLAVLCTYYAVSEFWRSRRSPR